MPKSLPTAAFSSWRSRIRHFKRTHTGATLPQYALLLAFIVGGGTLAYHTLGTTTEQTFGELASLDSTAEHPEDSTSSAGPKSSRAATFTANMAAIASRLPQSAGWYVALALAMGVAAYLLVHFRRARKRSHYPSAGQKAGQDLPADQSRQLFEKRQQIFNILSRDASVLLGDAVEVHHLMSRDPLTVPPTMSSEDVRQLMESERFRHLLVCSNENRLLGIISDRDVKSRDGVRAETLMTPDPIVASPDTPVGQAITRMLAARISCLPILEDGVPIGVLTGTDLAMSLHSVLQVLLRISAELRVHGKSPAAEIASSESKSCAPKSCAPDELDGRVARPFLFCFCDSTKHDEP